VKVAEVFPLATVTVDGRMAAAFDEVIVTTDPSPLAFAVRLTVPVEVEPPRTDAGESVTLDTFCADASATTQPKTKATATFNIDFTED